MIRVRSSTGVKALASIRVRDGAGVRAIANIKVRDGTGVKSIWSASGSGGSFTVNALPPVAYGGVAVGGLTAVYSEDITVSPVGGVAPYTYAWSLVSGDAGTWVFSSGTSATTRVGRTAVGTGLSYSHTVKCTVTDANGNTADSPDIDVFVQNYGDYGGLLP